MGVNVDFITSGGGLYRTMVITKAPVLENGDMVVDIDVAADLYSDGKEDWHSTPSLRTHRFPIDATGGEPKPGGAVGSTFFMEDDWSILPHDSSHRLRIKGNLYRRNGTTPFLQRPGRTINIERDISAIVESAAAGGGGGGEADWDLTERSQIRLRLGIDGSKGTPGSTPDLVQKSDVLAQTATLQGDIAAVPSAVQNAAAVWVVNRTGSTPGTYGAVDEWAGNVDVGAIAAASATATWELARGGFPVGSFGATDEWASTLTIGGIAAGVWGASRSSPAPGTYGAVDEYAGVLASDLPLISGAVWAEPRGGFPVGSYGAVGEWTWVSTVGDVAGGVWTQPRASFTATGTFGATPEWALNDEGVIADAVLDSLISAHQTPGTLGQMLKRMLDMMEAKVVISGDGTVMDIYRRSDDVLMLSVPIEGGNAVDVTVG